MSDQPRTRGARRLAATESSGPALRKRRGLRQAIENRDAAEILRIIESRSSKNNNGCWVWPRTTPQGYPQVSRDPSIYVHRLALWARNGCKGRLNRLPPAHHFCFVRACANPDHLAFVSAQVNSVEVRARTAMLKRIADLTSALADADPENELLDEWPDAAPGGVLEGRTLPAAAFLSDAELLRREQRRRQQAAARELKAAQRFEQVVRARRLIRDGMNTREAASAVFLTKSTFDAWNRRWLEQRLGYQAEV